MFDWGDNNNIVTSTVMLSTLLVLTLLRAKQPALEMRKSFFGLIYVYVPMIYVIQTSVESPKLILFIFIMIWSSDTFAYLVGRGFGKHPFAPKLSPKKTTEGFVGGILGTLVVGTATNHFWGLTSMPIALFLAVTVSLIAPFGDLVASALKREADVKDSGVFLPGHGGALDRLDSFITAAPISILIYQHLI
jgi:phosphatidate cytidylyltransferase